MSETTQPSGPDPRPGEGEAPRGAERPALNPARLMSGVLRADDETAVPDDAGAVRGGDRRSFDLPCELGDYTLVATLGRGGMGTVYEAVQRSTGRRLALKLLAQDLDSHEMRQRFLREGRLAARVNHPSSLYVFGSEEIDGIPVITMEIAPGGTLQDAIDRRGPLPVAEAVDAALSMVDGLEAALERGVLHRDIKPSNCFVSPDGRVKVGDFGLSVSTLPSADSFMTQTGKVMGTPAFASPEQLRGDEVDARSDIYAVGATLFTLLTALAPFEVDNAVQVVAHVIDTPPADVSAVRDDVPAGLAQVIARCMAKEPGGRYADYAALRNALLPFSSVVPEPATQSQRTAAGWVDYLSAFLPGYATLMITVGPERLLIRPMYEFSFDAWRYQLLVYALGFAYFAIAEGVWGTGLGKWIMNLRVVTKAGRRPGVGRALLRIMIPILAIECVRVPLSVVTLPSGEWGTLNVLLFTGLAIFCPWIAALLWMPARRSNGFAAAWDLLTATRVVVRPRGSRRPALLAVHDAETGDENARLIGPFRVVSAVEQGSWLAGEDPVLRRGVWLIRRDGASVGDARRAVARPGRSRWLQEVEAEGGVWDAYEAARGAPLSEVLAGGTVRWSTLRHWLHDLASELRATERDGTLPGSCTLGQVWIRDDGRAVLLDKPWPGAGGSPEHAVPVAVRTLEGQQAFLQRIAEHVDPLTVPLHARAALQNLRSGSFEKLTFLAGTLQGLLHKPADISRGLRGVSMLVIPGYATIATMLGIAANTDPSVGPVVWLGRVAIAVLVMMHFVALFDLILAFARKSTGLTTFGLEVFTRQGRASRGQMLARAAMMWLPVVLPTGVLGAMALADGVWIRFEHAALLGGIATAFALAFVGSALRSPARGLHDRLAGVWIGRR